MIRIVLILSLIVTSAAHPQELLRLPVRAHLLSGGANSMLSTSYDSAAVVSLLAVANGIWRSAGIEWELESILREQAARAPTYDSLFRGEIPRPREPLIGFVPTDNFLNPGWNVFLIRDFDQIAGGMFDPEIRGVILAQRGMGYDLAPEGRGGATLAHEFGHSLGLAHETCDATRNIMANGCWRADSVSTLTPAQIDLARRNAAVGRPVGYTPRP